MHPQSLVHCLVEFNDGAMLAQLSPSSMTFPIQHALLYPDRYEGVEPPIDLTQLLRLDFKPVDEDRYPMFRLARQALKAGGVAPAVFNASNEVAVEAFLNGRIPFLAIPRIVAQALDRTANFEPSDIAGVLGADSEARRGSQADVDSLK
jgi:1-deoxy-D-xylulose-5-phosphate reductoisomerase